METNNFYVYLHIRKDNGEPFYIGMGSPKWNRVNSKKNRNQWWHNITKKYDYDYIFLENNLTEDQAFELEKYWIKRIGRKDLGFGSLVNLTDGGEGKSGCKHTNESKNKISINTKKGMTPEVCKLISEREKGRNKGKTWEERYDQETIDRLRKNPPMKDKVHSEKTKNKMRGHKTGKLVLNIETGIFYQSCREAATYCCFNPNTLKNMLSGRGTNKTELRYV